MLQLAGKFDEKKKIAEGDSDDEDNEVALNAFAGRCFNCNKFGHRAAECREKKMHGNDENGHGNGNGHGHGNGHGNGNGGGNNRGGAGRVYCNSCGKPGHKAANCWILPENAHKRPADWRHPNGSSEMARSIMFLGVHLN